MSDKLFSFESVGKWKLLLLLVLLLLTSVIWSKSLFFSSKDLKVVEQRKSMTSNSKNKSQIVNRKSFSRNDFKKKFGAKDRQRRHPFLENNNSEAEFTYQSNSNSEILNLNEINSNLHLLGIINKNKQTAVIMNYNGQSFLLRVGEEIGGFKLLAIDNNKAKFLKDKKQFVSALEVKNKN